MRAPYALAGLLALAAHVAMAAPTSSTNTQPTAIPAGPAGGDLAGTYPNPTLANSATARTNLGLGTSAVFNLGTSGANIPLMNGTNTWSAVQTMAAPIATGSLLVSGSGAAPAATTTGVQVWNMTAGAIPMASFTDAAQAVNNRDFSISWSGGVASFGFFADGITTESIAFSCSGGRALGATGCNFAAPIQVGGNLALTSALPTITSGFGTTPVAPATTTSIGANSFAFTIGTGGTASTGVLGMPTAAHGWNCHFTDETTQSTGVTLTKQTADTASSVTVTQFTDVSVAGAWVAGDVVLGMCFPR